MMKYKWDKKYFYWGVTAFLVVVCSILFFFLIASSGSILSALKKVIGTLEPVLYGLALAYLLQPIVRFFENLILKLVAKRIKKPYKAKRKARAVSIFITMLLALLVLVALFSMILPQLIVSIRGIVENFPKYSANVMKWVSHIIEDNKGLTTTVNSFLSDISTDITTLVSGTVLPQADQLVSGVTSGVIGFISTIINIAIGFVVAIYVLFSKDLFLAQSKKIIYALLPVKHANTTLKITREAHRVFSRFIVGSILNSLVLGLLCFILMSIMGTPFALLASVIVGLTNVIPYFGPIIGTVISALIIFMVSPKDAIYFVIMIVILQQVDNHFLTPKILGEQTGLSSFWVLFSLLLCGGLFGFMGLILGVPIFALIYSGIKLFVERRLEKKKLSSSTKAYEDVYLVDNDTNEFINNKKDQ